MDEFVVTRTKGPISNSTIENGCSSIHDRCGLDSMAGGSRRTERGEMVLDAGTHGVEEDPANVACIHP